MVIILFLVTFFNNTKFSKQGGQWSVFYQNNYEVLYEINVWIQKAIGASSHLHNSSEFIYVSDGLLKIESGNKSQIVCKGEIATISACTPHTLRSLEDGRYIVMTVPTDKLEKHISTLCENTFENLKICDVPQNIIGNLFEIMISMSSLGEEFGDIEKSHMANLIVNLIVPRCTIAKRPHSLDIITNTVNYIMENISYSDLSVREIARSMHCNQQKLSLEFRSVMQKSITEYITLLRLEKAKKLLLSSQKTTVESIALMVGFNCTRNFLRCYKNHFGCTPTQTRNTSVTP